MEMINEDAIANIIIDYKPIALIMIANCKESYYL